MRAVCSTSHIATVGAGVTTIRRNDPPFGSGHQDEPASASRRCLWNRLWSSFHKVRTIQVVVDEPTLRAADREAKRAKVNRSALIRHALRDYLERRRIAEIEAKERDAYQRMPVKPGEFDWLVDAAAWPED